MNRLSQPRLSTSPFVGAALLCLSTLSGCSGWDPTGSADTAPSLAIRGGGGALTAQPDGGSNPLSVVDAGANPTEEKPLASAAKPSPDELAALFNASLVTAGVAGWENLESEKKGSYADVVAAAAKPSLTPTSDASKEPDDKYAAYLDALAKQNLTEDERAELKSSILESTGGDAL